MSFLIQLLTQHRFLIVALTLVVGSIALAGCGRDAPKAQAETAPETALEHARKHLDPTYVCPMHPQVVSAEPGECPICGMDLVLKKVAAAAVDPKDETAMEHARKHLDPTYVCPMHPQVVSAEPGECPICGMDLVLKKVAAADRAADTAAAGPVTVTVSDAVVNQLGVRTAAVRRGTLTPHVEGFGTFLGSLARTFRPANRPSDPTLSDGGASTSFVIAQVFEREASQLRQGQTARVRFPTLGAREWTGTVSSLEGQINPLTRSLQLRVAIDLEGASVPGGMSALVVVEAEPLAGVLLVPREAVILTGKGARVVVAQDGGRFQQRQVQAEDLGEDEILIHSGLEEGERVVVSAQFLLDSEANLQAGLNRLSGGEPAAVEPPAATMQEEADHDAAMHEGAVHQGPMTQGAMHEEAMPAGAMEEGATHEGTMHETGASEGAMPVGTMHEASVPQGSTQEGATGEAGVLEATMPEATMPESTMPEGTMPEGTMPEGTMPAAHPQEPAAPQGASREGTAQ